MPKINRPVSWSEDLRRVVALPTRTWAPGAAEHVAEQWSPALHTPAGAVEWRRFALLGHDAREREIADYSREVCPVRLSPDQVILLWEWLQCRGVISLAPVGVGKTLAAYLMARLAELHWGTTRTVLALPAYLRQDALDNHQKYSAIWEPPRHGIHVLSYNELSGENNAFRLCACLECTGGVPAVHVWRGERPPEPPPNATAAQLQEHHRSYALVVNEPINPEVLLLDEADMAGSFTSAVGARIGRFKGNHPSVPCAVLSGSFGDELTTMFRQATWALGVNAPVPFTFLEQQAWSEAMSYEIGRATRQPGALLEAFGADLTREPRSAARIAYAERLDRTPGFVIIDRPSCTTDIHIRVLTPPRDPIIEEGFPKFREKSLAHDDWVLDPLGASTYGAARGLGYYPSWDPRPPIEWLRARSAYNALVNDVIKNSRRRRGPPIETEKQARRFIQGAPEVIAWDEIQARPDAFVPNPVHCALSPSVINWVKEWLEMNSPAIVWVDSTWFGQTLSQLTGVRYLATKGKDELGRSAERGESMIASVKSNYRGRDWWAWNRALLVASIGKNTWHEQIIGRQHRRGQREPIYLDYLATSGETLKAFADAHRRAVGTEETYKLRPKILTANWNWQHVPEEILDHNLITDDEGYRARWYQKENDRDLDD